MLGMETQLLHVCLDEDFARYTGSIVSFYTVPILDHYAIHLYLAWIDCMTRRREVVDQPSGSVFRSETAFLLSTNTSSSDIG